MTRMQQRMFWLAMILAFAPLVFGSCSANGLFYRPDHRVYATPAGTGMVIEEVFFQAPGGPTLHGWWAPATGKAKGTVVFCHGNHRNLSHHFKFVWWLPKHGFNLLLFDYRGYGRSQGSVTRAGTVADSIAAIDFALARDPERVVVFGHSLGGAVAVPAVAQRPAVKALVVESTFPSYRAEACAVVPALCPLASFLISSDLDPEDYLANIPPRPLLVIHGTDDRIVPFRLGLQLYKIAAEPKTLFEVKGGGHATPWLYLRSSFEQMLVEFFEKALGWTSRIDGQPSRYIEGR